MAYSQPTISIIIPTYNRSKLLYYTLSSICKQRDQHFNMEIIVVDDGSSDDTYEVALSFKDILTLKYLFQEDKGYRVASARNLGIRHSSGEIIVFIDSGMILSPDCIASHLESHQQTKEATAVIGYMLGLEEPDTGDEILPSQINTDDPETSITSILASKRFLDIREKTFKLCRDDLSTLPAPWALFWTGNASVKTIAIESVGSFDTNYDGRWGVEDIDLGFRLFKNGTQFILNRKATAIHYPHGGNLKNKLVEEYQNKVYFHQKNQSIESEILLHATHSAALNTQVKEG